MSFRSLPLLLSRRSVLLVALGLAGCGFSPVYGTGGSATALRSAVAFEVPDTVAGYRLRTRLAERLGDTRVATYQLTVGISQATTPATITTDGDTTRFNLAGTATWVLRDTAGVALKDGTVDAFTSYSATGSTVATTAAETDAQARLSVALADLIVAQVIIAAPEFTQ